MANFLFSFVLFCATCFTLSAQRPTEVTIFGDGDIGTYLNDISKTSSVATGSIGANLKLPLNRKARTKGVGKNDSTSRFEALLFFRVAPQIDTTGEGGYGRSIMDAHYWNKSLSFSFSFFPARKPYFGKETNRWFDLGYFVDMSYGGGSWKIDTALTNDKKLIAMNVTAFNLDAGFQINLVEKDLDIGTSGDKIPFKAYLKIGFSMRQILGDITQGKYEEQFAATSGLMASSGRKRAFHGFQIGGGIDFGNLVISGVYRYLYSEQDKQMLGLTGGQVLVTFTLRAKVLKF